MHPDLPFFIGLADPVKDVPKARLCIPDYFLCLTMVKSVGTIVKGEGAEEMECVGHAREVEVEIMKDNCIVYIIHIGDRYRLGILLKTLSATSASFFHILACRNAYAFAPEEIRGSAIASLHVVLLCKKYRTVHCISYVTRTISSCHLFFKA